MAPETSELLGCVAVGLFLVVTGWTYCLADGWLAKRRRAAETRAWCRRWLARYGL